MQGLKTVVLVNHVGPILDVFISGKHYLKQSLFVTEFTTRPNKFEIQLWNASIAKFNLLNQNLKDKRCFIETYINGRTQQRGNDQVYEVTITLASIVKIDNTSYNADNTSK